MHTMDPRTLGQSLLIRPDYGFAKICEVLGRLGWEKDAREPRSEPLVAGEPEFAGWLREPRDLPLSYTFNPVVGLRLLDVARLGPDTRAELAAALPLLSREELVANLSSSNARARLLGIFGLQEVEALESVGSLRPLVEDSVPEVGSAAQNAVNQLEQTAAARSLALASVQLVRTRVEPLLRRLASGDVDQVSSLKPTAEDYPLLFAPQLFDGRLSPDLASCYEQLWQRPPSIRPGADYSELDVVAAPAGMLRSHNPLSERFPGGYRSIAGWMQPERVWVCWSYRRPQQHSGVSYDGLVWLGNRWLWCPKPYRAIGEGLEALASKRTS
jgi:hypothetical protein